jgi:formylglycine-generating enzyme required for sulfatase activity
MRRWWQVAAVALAVSACDDEAPAPAVDAAVPEATCPETAPDGWACMPAGTYRRGSPDDEPLRDPDEERHEVELTRPFLIKTTEVTQREWLEHVDANPAHGRPDGPGMCRGDTCLDRPVEQVNFFEALVWLNAASEAEGLSPCYAMPTCAGFVGDGCEDDQTECVAGFRCDPDAITWHQSCTGYRLPTEAEWEYAARAGESEAQYSALSAIAWFSTNAMLHTHTVAQKAANSAGLMDVLGNVGEWCWDRYAQDYGIFKASRQINIDPLGAEFTDTRVIKGGGFLSGAKFCRLAARENLQAALRNHALGFRPVRTIF